MASKAIGFLNFKFSADLTAFERAMKKAQKNLKKFGKNLKKTGQTLSRNLTLPILGLGAAALKLGSDFQETDAKFKTVFSSIQKEAENTAQSLKQNFGLSELASKDLLSATGDLLVGFGFTEEKALELSNSVNELAVDLASFTNFSGGAKGASEALTKALLGERESIKSLGIAITETDLKAFAAEHGLVWKELDRVTKAQLTFEMAQKQSTKAIGDFKRTSGSFANQLRIVKADLVDLGVELGTRLIPIAQKAIGFIKGLVAQFDGLTESQKDNIVKWGLILAAVGPVLIILGTLTIAIGALMTPIGLATLAIGSLTTAIIYFKTSASNVAIDVRNNFATMSNSIISNVNIAIAAMNMLGAGMDLIPMTALEKKSSTTAASGSGFSKAIKGAITKYKAFLENLKNDSDGGGIGEPGAGLEKTVEQMEALSLATNDTFEEISLLSHRLDGLEMPENLFNTDPMDKYRGALGMLGDEIAAFAGTDIKSLEEGLAAITERLGDELAQGADSFQEYADNVKGMIKEVIGALISQGVAAAVSKSLISAGIINPFLIPVVAGLAAGLARTAFNSLIPSFADGGIVSGPTVGLMGEYPGASSNPEVIAPLDKLKSMIGGGSQNIIVEGVLKGNDIYLSNRNTSINRLRTT